MIPTNLEIKTRKCKTWRITASCVALVLTLQSGAAFFAEIIAGQAVKWLDDPQPEHRDVIDLTDDTIPAYTRSIAALELAKILAPLNEGYDRSAAELLFRVAVWQDLMAQLDKGSPIDAAAGSGMRERAFRHMERAVSLDPAGAGVTAPDGHNVRRDQRPARASYRTAGVAQPAASRPVESATQFIKRRTRSPAL